MGSPRTKIIDGIPWHYTRLYGWMPGRGKNHKTRPRAKPFNKKLWIAFNHHCGICGLIIAKETQISEDHVVPRSKEGSLIKNSIPSHIACNNRKANRDPTACELIVLMVVNLNLYHEL